MVFLLSWKLTKLLLNYFVYKLKFQTKQYKIVFFQEGKIMHRYICLQYSLGWKTKRYIIISIFHFTRENYFALFGMQSLCFGMWWELKVKCNKTLKFKLVIKTSLFLPVYTSSLGLTSKESACQCKRHVFDPWVGKIPWRRKWQPTPIFLPGKSHAHRSLTGYRVTKRVRHDLVTK